MNSFMFPQKQLMEAQVFMSIQDSYKIRNDLKLLLPRPGVFETTLIEIIIVIVGCIYRHPSSNLPVNQFNNDYIEPLLQKISTENKTCSLMGDFNIDLLKASSLPDVNLPPIYKHLTLCCTYIQTSDIILHLDLNKPLSPNSLPTFIMKLCTEFFSTYLTKILNISFVTGIFLIFVKWLKLHPFLRKMTHLIVLIIALYLSY